MNVKLENIRHVFFIGIGGIGMSALARYFHQMGCAVVGYDRTESDLTRALEGEGISVFYEDNVKLIPKGFETPSEDNLVVYTPAVPQDLSVKNAFQRRGFELLKRSEVLGLISKEKFTIAVAGTHGKTTTSTLIAHVLTQADVECSAFLGGISANFNSNILISEGDIVVVEADEFDRSFLTLHPDIAVVTSLQADHLDIYSGFGEVVKSFEDFLGQIKPDGKSVVRKGLKVSGDMSYGLEKEADARAEDIEIKNGDFYFTYRDQETVFEKMYMAVPGYHNVENAVAAISVGRLLGIDLALIKQGLATFKGVKRRFEYIVKNEKNIYIDDYAHHPAEVEAFLTSVRKMYPRKKLTVVFQPHLYSRTRDFAEDFAQALSLGDQLFLLDIYPARELPIEGVSSEWLIEKVSGARKEVVSKEKLLERVGQEKPELIVTMGAGDIDRLVKPIKEKLEANA